MPSHESDVNAHYGTEKLAERILQALKDAGVDLNKLTREDLSSFDEFHVGGIAETRNVAQIAKINSGMHVLDLGCGVGGPARTLAAEFGCRVTGIDATHEFCRTATMLTERVRLSDKVDFVEGSAIDIPFEDDNFDVVWFQHVGMNIQSKEKLYSEIRRVLKPNGMFVFHEIMEGNGELLQFPVPWAAEQNISFLISAEDARKQLDKLGFVQEYWADVTERSTAWAEKRFQTRTTSDPQPVSIGALLGRDVSAYFGNLIFNLKAGRIRIIEACYKLT